MPSRFTLLVLALAGLALGLTPRSAAAPVTIVRDATPTKPGVVSFTITAPGYQRGPKRLEVLVPDRVAPGRRLPVVYLLPVNTGLDGPWGSPIEQIRRHDLANRHQVICVVPTYDVEPWFGDLPAQPADSAPLIRQQAYLTDIVLPLVEREFPALTEREGRFLIGFSKSGFGALALLLRHTELFAAAAVYDCADPDVTPENFVAWQLPASYGTRANYDENFHVPTLLARHGAALRDGPRRVALLAGSAQYVGVANVLRALAVQQVPHSHHVFPGMDHRWDVGWLPVAFAALPLPPPSR